jgi:hypothetical protein
MKFQIDMHVQRVEYPRLRTAFFSEAFNRELLEAVDLKERKILEHVTQPDGTERMRVRIVPNVHLPSSLKKLIGDHAVQYEELTTFDPQARCAHVTVHSLADAVLKVRADARFVDEPGGAVGLRVQGEVKASLFGLGGFIERHVASEVTARYAKVERALQRFVDEHRDLEQLSP